MKPPETIDHYVAEEALQFTSRCIQKFAKGRQEHNQSLDEIDYIDEMLNELADMVNYLNMLKWQLQEDTRYEE